MPRHRRSSLVPSRASDPASDAILAAAALGRDMGVEGSFATDLAVWVPEDLMVKVDRMTMAHGLEARPPFLDHLLVEATLRRCRSNGAGDRAATRRSCATTRLRSCQRDGTPPEADVHDPDRRLAARTARGSNAEATTALLDWGIDRAALGACSAIASEAAATRASGVG